jgi:hypothetical protein
MEVITGMHVSILLMGIYTKYITVKSNTSTFLLGDFHFTFRSHFYSYDVRKGYYTFAITYLFAFI